MNLAWIALLLSLPQQPTTVTVDGLMNGNFDMVLDHGTIGDPALQIPVDGAYWIGAEGLTSASTAPDRALQMQAGAIAYQRVGAAEDAGVSARLIGRVWVPGPVGAKHEARVSFSDGTGLYWSLDWVMRNFFRPGDLDPTGKLVRWQVFYSDDGGATRTPMTWTGGAFSAGNFLLDHRGGFIAASQATDVESFVETVWVAPHDGWVRVMNRPWKRFTGGEDIRYETWKVSAGLTTAVRVDSLDTQDINGPQIVARVYVSSGDEIRLRAVRPNAAGSPASVDYAGNPVVSYEGNTVTYRFGHKLDPIAGTAAEKFVIRDIGAVGLDRWTPFSLAAGVDFTDASTGYGTSPMPPLDVKLSTPALASVTNVVKFDAVRCLVDFERISEQQLRDEILDEARWARDLVTGLNNCASGPGGASVLDRDSRGCQRGRTPTPYRAHGLFLRSGRELFAPANFPNISPEEEFECTHRIQVDAPLGVWDLLRHEFDIWHYAAFFRIRENMMHKDNISPAGFMYTKYDTVLDQYLRNQYWSHPCGTYPNGVPDPADYEGGVASKPYQLLLDLYEYTNHPHFLDRALKVALKFVEKGVLTEVNVPPNRPDRTGFIAYAGFDIETGDLIYVDPMATLFGPAANDGYEPRFNLSASGTDTQIYAAARIFNVEQAPHFPESQLDEMGAKLAASFTAAIKARNPTNFVNCGIWFDKWPEGNSGIFNDHWGYQGQDALGAYKKLIELAAVRTANQISPALTPDEQSMVDDIEQYWLREGSEVMFTYWEQAIARGGYVAGDHVRGWPMFEEVITNPAIVLSDPGLRDKFERHLIRAALFAAKFQYVHYDEQQNPVSAGIWTAGALGRFQLLDISRNNLHASANHSHALGHALAMPNISTADRQHALSLLHAQLEANIRHFKADDPSTPEPQDGYGYWPNAFYKGPPGGGDWTGGWEWRPLASMLAVLDLLGASATNPQVPAAVPDISPENYKQTGGQTYTFTLRWPSNLTLTQAQRAEQFQDRTVIYLWIQDPGSGWQRKILHSPFAPSNGNIPLGLSSFPNTSSMVIPTSIPVQLPAFSGSEQEIEIVSWDESGLWNRDTSFQRKP